MAQRTAAAPIPTNFKIPPSRSAMRKEVMITHGCRKFFNTMMVKAAVYVIIKEQLMGHSAGLDKSYNRPSDEDVLNEYMKAEPLLTIDPNKKLENQVKQLKMDNQQIHSKSEAKYDKLVKWLMLHSNATKDQLDELNQIDADYVEGGPKAGYIITGGHTKAYLEATEQEFREEKLTELLAATKSNTDEDSDDDFWIVLSKSNIQNVHHQ